MVPITNQDNMIESLNLSTHLVAHSLTRPGDVPPHLPLNVLPAGGRVVQHEVHGLLHAPAQRVHPGVDDQPAGPEDVLTEVAEPVQRVRVEPSSVPRVSQ